MAGFSAFRKARGAARVILLFFILCFTAMHYFTRDLVNNSKVYAVRMMLSCLVFYALTIQIGVLL